MSRKALNKFNELLLLLLDLHRLPSGLQWRCCRHTRPQSSSYIHSNSPFDNLETAGRSGKGEIQECTFGLTHGNDSVIITASENNIDIVLTDLHPNTPTLDLSFEIIQSNGFILIYLIRIP